MSAPPYMKLYVADYLGDTHHLGALEHGAYLLLLMAMWRAGGSLPAADSNLSRLARCTTDQWADIRDVVLAYFKRSRGRLTHKRLAAEMAKYENTSGKRSEAGKRGAAEKASKNKASAPAIADPAESNCTHNQNHNQNQKEEEIEGAQVLPFAEAAPAERRPPAASRGARLKPDWSPSVDNLGYAAKEGFSEPETARMVEGFRDYWTSAAGQKATKLDWSAAWRTWVRNQRDRQPGRGGPAQRRQDFV